MARRTVTPRSTCPLALALDVLGDRWTLLVIRDLVFTRKRRFGEFLESPEGIASNILADRLRRLEQWGIVTRRTDPASARQVIYRLTDKGKDLIPVVLELMRWGATHDAAAATPKTVARRIRGDREGFAAELRAALD
jgi:DNA-binding HxlR family transcriptional regulator